MNTSLEVYDEVLIKAKVTKIYSIKPGEVKYILRLEADDHALDVGSDKIIARMEKEIKEGATDGCEDAEKP